MEERPDIALANDRMLNNAPPKPYTRWEDYHAAERNRSVNNDWATEGETLMEVVERMIDNGKTSGRFWKDSIVYQEPETIRYDICIKNGWSCEEFEIDINQKESATIEIYLRFPL